MLVCRSYDPPYGGEALLALLFLTCVFVTWRKGPRPAPSPLHGYIAAGCGAVILSQLQYCVVETSRWGLLVVEVRSIVAAVLVSVLLLVDAVRAYFPTRLPRAIVRRQA